MLDKYLKPLGKEWCYVAVFFIRLLELLFTFHNETTHPLILWCCRQSRCVAVIQTRSQNFHTGVSGVCDSCSPHYFQVWYILRFQLEKLVFINQAWKQFFCAAKGHLWSHTCFSHTFPWHLWCVSLCLLPFCRSLCLRVQRVTYVQSILEATFTHLFYTFRSFLKLNNWSGKRLLSDFYI